MNKEKQIEELGTEIYQHCSAGLFEDEANAIAEFVINKQGYRKASEVAEQIFRELETVFYHITTPVIKANGRIDTRQIEGLHLSFTDYKTIKKKYTEEEKSRDKIAEFGKYSPFSWKNTEDTE